MFQPIATGKGHGAPIYGATLWEHQLYTTSGDRFVVRWEISSGLQDGFTVKLDSPAYSIAVLNATLVIGSTNGTLTAIDVQSKRILWEHNPFGNAWMSLQIDPTDNFLYAGDASGNFYVVQVETGKKVIHLPLACGKIRDIQFYKNALYLATQTEGVIGFDKTTFAQGLTYPMVSASANCLCFVKDQLAIGAGNGHVYLFDLQSNQPEKSLPIHYQAIYGIDRVGSFWVSVSMDKTIKIWDNLLKICEQRIELKQGGHHRSVNGVIGIDETRFITYSDDKTWILWQNKIDLDKWSEN